MRKLKRTKPKLILIKTKKVKDINSLDNKNLQQKKLKASVRRLKALELRKEGKSYQEIANILGSNFAQVYTDIGIVLKKEIEKRTKTQLGQVVQLELERLDALFEKAWEQIKANNVVAIDKALKIMERRAKYLGLDAPAKSVVGEDPEKPFRGDKNKLKTTLMTMIRNKQKQVENKEEKESQMENKNVVNS
jgi:DNA-binding CsgD family transcriptional regulator